MACRMWLRQISCKGRSIFSSHWSHFPLLAIFSFPWTWHLEQKCFRQELHWNKKKIGYKKKYKLFLLAKENNTSQPLLPPKNIIATYNCSVSLFECSLINVTLYFVGLFTRRWILYRLFDSYNWDHIIEIKPNTETYKNSFYCRTIKDWNSLPNSVLGIDKLINFKEAIRGI